MPRAPMFQDTAIRRMTEMYELGGCSLAKIAAEFSVSVPTVAKYLRRAGISINKRGRPPKKNLVAREVVKKLGGYEEKPLASVTITAVNEEEKSITVSSEQPASIFRG